MTKANNGLSAAPAANPDDSVKMRLAGPIIAGVIVILLFFGAFGGWAATAPLERATIAPGTVIVNSSRKTIQHLEGGIIAEILVQEGDLVEEGQPLILLEETRASASLALLQGRYSATAAREARLVAERNSAERITFPDWLLEKFDESRTSEAIEGQKRIFLERRKALQGQTDILRQQIAQFNEEIHGMRGQIAAESEQSRLIAEELGDMKSLLAKQLIPKSRVLALERRASEIVGSVSLNKASIARARQSIGETELQIRELQTSSRNEAASELRETQTELFDIEERLRAAQDVVRRTEIRAPQRGTVLNMRIHTPGGVVSPGQELMDIVPSDDKLVIIAKIRPDDVDVAHSGLPAHVRLTAFSQRSFIPIEGKVTQVSADHLIDENTGRPYFAARVELEEASLKAALGGSAIYPGMQAEVMIIIGKRTTLDYILQPFRQSFNRALRDG